MSDDARPPDDHATFIDVLEEMHGDDVRIRDVAVVVELGDGETVRVLGPSDTPTAVGLLSRSITVLSADRRGSE